MEPIFRGDEAEGLGHRAQFVGLPEHYREQNHRQMLGPMRLTNSSRSPGLDCRMESSHQLRARNARGDFPGAHRIDRMASMSQTQDSNDDDGETSSASEDSAFSAGYPSPQVRAQRSAKRTEPCAAIHLPPAQRARLQQNDTEPALRAGWSSAQSGAAVCDTQRQLPRLAALEAIPQKQRPHHQQQTQQKHLAPSVQQHQPMSQQQTLQHSSVSSGSSSVTPQMQLPSLMATGRSTVVPAAPVPSVRSAASAAAVAAEVPVSAASHRLMLQVAQQQHDAAHRLPLPTPLHSQTAYSGWSHNARRQVPRMDGFTIGGADRTTSMAGSAMTGQVHDRRQWDPLWSNYASRRGALDNGAYRADTRYDRQHENSWVVQQDSTVASASFGWAEAGRRHDASPPSWVLQQGEGLKQQQNQQQQQREHEQRHQFVPQHESEPRYTAQAMQPQVQRGSDVTRTPSPVYRNSPTHASPQSRGVASKNAERGRSGGWTSADNGVVNTQNGEWAPGAPRPASGQAGKQILQRYLNHLNPKASREVWSHDEEEVLWRAQEVYGNAWSFIAGLLPGRSENAVKNHWYTQMRMYIGQRDAANAKAAGPGASTDASGPGGDSAASMKTARQCRSLKKPDEEKSAEAKPSASMTLAAGGNTSSCPKHDTETRAEKEARAEAVAALGLLFAQGSPGVPSGTSSLVMQQQQQQGQTPCCDDGSRGRLPGFNPGRTESR